MEVVVLLHVHVDKDLVGTFGRSLIQRAQALLEALYRAIDIPVIELGHHGGSLDRNVGYAWVLDELEGALRAGLSLFLTEHGLTQQVEVELFAGFGGLVQNLVECIRLGVQNQVANHLAHVQAGNRHDQVGQDWTEEATGTNERTIDAAQERRVIVGGNILQRVCGNLVIFWAHDAVDEVHGELHSVLIAQ